MSSAPMTANPLVTHTMELGILSPPPTRKNPAAPLADPPNQRSWTPCVYGMFIVFGIASLTPWNMFITATAYFESKFNGSSPAIEENFTNYFQTGAICVDVIVSFLTVALVRCVPMPNLIYTANSLMLLMFALTSFIAKIDTTDWPGNTVFLITEVSFCIMCGSGALFINTMWAITSSLDTAYTDAFLIGMTLAGIIASLLNIITLSIPGIDFVGAGFWYFVTATLLLTISLGLFVYFHVNIYNHKYAPIKSGNDSDVPSTPSGSPPPKSKSMIALTKEAGTFLYSSFMILFATFVMFPGVLATTESSANNQDSIWVTKYFKPVSIFLTFNIGDFVGRLLACKWEFPSRTLIPWYATSRLGFAVLFIMCNLQPRSLPVWFPNDIVFTVLIFLFAMVNGQSLTLALRYAPEIGKETADKATIGTLMGFAGAIGRISGSLMTYLVLMIVR